MNQVFVIPGRLDGLNEYTKACRAKKYVGAAVKKRNEANVLEAIEEAGLKPMNTPVNVKLTFYEQPNRGQMRDKDNIQFAVKFILDALVRAGIIEDDGFYHIGKIDPDCIKTEREPRIAVYLEEVEG